MVNKKAETVRNDKLETHIQCSGKIQSELKLQTEKNGVTRAMVSLELRIKKNPEFIHPMCIGTRLNFLINSQITLLKSLISFNTAKFLNNVSTY